MQKHPEYGRNIDEINASTKHARESITRSE
jgi:hypothetical protein